MTDWEPSEQFDEWDGCRTCVFIEDDLTCRAFPHGIPLPIVAGEVDHMVVRPDQVGETVYESKNGDEDEDKSEEATRSGTSALKAAIDPRDEAERRLREALAAMFDKLAPEVARKIMAGEAVSDAELAEAFRAVLQPELARIATDEQLRIGAEIGVQFDPAVINAAAVEWSKTYSYELVKGITETTRQIIAAATEQFLATPGMTVGELTTALEPAFGIVRAEMQAITETTRAYSAATEHYQRMLEQQGIKMERVWRTSADERVCLLICDPLNGKPEGQWGDYANGPPGHVRCRCGTTLQLAKAK